MQRRQDATAPQIKPRGQQQSAALHNLNSGQQMVKAVSWLKNKQGQVTSGWGKGPIIVKVVNKSFTYKAKQAPPPMTMILSKKTVANLKKSDRSPCKMPFHRFGYPIFGRICLGKPETRPFWAAVNF